MCIIPFLPLLLHNIVCFQFQDFNNLNVTNFSYYPIGYTEPGPPELVFDGTGDQVED